jgi:peptidoglycan/LPS O-acetylase OafA/YrhL
MGFLYNVISHVLFFHNLSPSWHGSINGPSWSIATEMQFYLLMLCLMPWLARQTPFRIVAYGCLTAWVLRAIVFFAAQKGQWDTMHTFIYATQMPMMLDLFGLGIAAALLVIKRPDTLPSTPILVGLSAGFLIAAFTSLSIYPSFWQFGPMVVGWRTLFGIGAVALLLLFVRVKPSPFVLTCAPYKMVSYLGDISYGLYLWHMPVILLLKQQNFATGSPILFGLLVLGITLILSALSWHLLERPLTRAWR